ncbi:MAG: hypothetical protein ACPGOY_15320 [Rhodospirillaceae bacterium]
MAKLQINLGLSKKTNDSDHLKETQQNNDIGDAEKLAALAAGLPSPSQAQKDMLKRAPRVSWTFNNIPYPIKQAFEEEAQRLGMTMKEYFLHCLRAGGLEIPSYDELDGRRR